jgi:hypothetical protein
MDGDTLLTFENQDDIETVDVAYAEVVKPAELSEVYAGDAVTNICQVMELAKAAGYVTTLGNLKKIERELQDAIKCARELMTEELS